MRIVKSFPMRVKVWCLVLGVVLLCSGACLADDLGLSVKLEQNGVFVRPSGNIMTFKQLPISFTVVMTNLSVSSLPVHGQAGTGGMSSLYLELTDEAGEVTEVRHRSMPDQSTLIVDEDIPPGQDLNKALVIDPDAWEHMPLFEVGKTRRYQLRVVYDNEDEVIYSDVYTFILDGQ